jgi:hypothetical protein
MDIKRYTQRFNRRNKWRVKIILIGKVFSYLYSNGIKSNIEEWRVFLFSFSKFFPRCLLYCKENNARGCLMIGFYCLILLHSYNIIHARAKLNSFSIHVSRPYLCLTLSILHEFIAKTVHIEYVPISFY